MIFIHESISIGDLVQVHVDMNGKVLKGAKKITKGTNSMLKWVGNGISHIDRGSLFSTQPITHGVAVKMTQTHCSFPSLCNVFPDIFFLQNRPSIITSYALCSSILRALSLQKFYIWDMCCGVGGKTTHIATLFQRYLKSNFKIIATDKSSNKLSSLKIGGSSLVERGSFIHFSDLTQFPTVCRYWINDPFHRFTRS